MDTISTLQPIPALKNAALYNIPKSIKRIKLKLNSNEGRFPRGLVNQLLAKTSFENINLYPNKANLEAMIADRFGLKPSQVLVTNGGDDALDRICRAFLCVGRELIFPTPSFEMIEKYAALCGATIRRITWSSNFPEQNVISIISDQTAVISLVTPNNPTGQTISVETIKRLSSAASNSLLLVDNAYGEFAEEDIAEAVLQLPNAVMVKTFSKAWGLAGLRVGYVMGPSKIISCFRAASGPYPVSSLSLQIAQGRFEAGISAIAPFIAQVKQERAILERFFLDKGFSVIISQANFVFVRTKRAIEIKERLEDEGILIRDFPSNLELKDALRITLPGNQEDFDYLLNALTKAL